MTAKLNKEICNGVVSIVFTSLFPYMSIVTLTFDLWPPKSIGFILSSWLTCLPSLTKKYATVLSLSCSQGPCTDGRTDGTTHGRTEPQQRYYIPTATRCAGITSIKLAPFICPIQTSKSNGIALTPTLCNCFLFEYNSVDFALHFMEKGNYWQNEPNMTNLMSLH